MTISVLCLPVSHTYTNTQAHTITHTHASVYHETSPLISGEFTTNHLCEALPGGPLGEPKYPPSAVD